jgi:hypothetical protein
MYIKNRGLKTLLKPLQIEDKKRASLNPLSLSLIEGKIPETEQDHDERESKAMLH